MGKLVKRAELTILGTLGIAIFSYMHMPAIMSSLDDMTSPDPAAYAASAAAPYVENTATAAIPDPSSTMPTAPSPMTESIATSSTAAPSVSETKITVQPLDTTEKAAHSKTGAAETRN